jgi:hypothetical protein
MNNLDQEIDENEMNEENLFAYPFQFSLIINLEIHLNKLKINIKF